MKNKKENMWSALRLALNLVDAAEIYGIILVAVYTLIK